MKKNIWEQYEARSLERLRRLHSTCSPNEIECYHEVFRNRIDAEVTRLEARCAESKREALKAEADLEKLKFALQTLANLALAKLSDSMLTNFCRAEILPSGATDNHWPRSDLNWITEHVQDVLKFTRVRIKRARFGKEKHKKEGQLWKHFKLFGKRWPSIQLPEQVDEFADRAYRLLKVSPVREARLSILWLWRIGHPSADKLLAFDQGLRAATRSGEERIKRERVLSKNEAALLRQRKHRAGPAGMA